MARALFWRLKANGQIVIGISSYQEFPGMITNPFDDRHVTEADLEIFGAVDGWLHCFRYGLTLAQVSKMIIGRQCAACYCTRVLHSSAVYTECVRSSCMSATKRLLMLADVV